MDPRAIGVATPPSKVLGPVDLQGKLEKSSFRGPLPAEFCDGKGLGRLSNIWPSTAIAASPKTASIDVCSIMFVVSCQFVKDACL